MNAPSALELFQRLSTGADTAALQQPAQAAWLALQHSADANTAHLRAVCVATVLTDYLVRWSDFRGLRAWLQRWADLQLPAAPAGADALLLTAGQLCALRLDEQVQADDDRLRIALDHALQLLRQQADAAGLALRVLHLPVVLECCQVMRRASIAQELEWQFTRHPDWPAVPPLWQARVHDSLASLYYVLDQPAEAERCRQQLAAVTAVHGLPSLRFEMLKLPLRSALEDGAVDAAGDMLTQMADLLDQHNLGQAVEYWDMRGRWLLARHEHNAAADAMARAVETANLGELPVQRRVVLWSMTSAIHLAMDQAEPCLAALRDCVAASTGVQTRVFEANLLVAQAWFAVRHHDSDAAQRLHAACAALSALNLVRFLRPLPQVAAQFCHHALEAGVDSAFIVRVIAARRLLRPADAGARWPTPVRVFCLGPGDVSLLSPAGGQSLVRGKAPARSLELLWWIGAHDGQPVSVQSCLKALWPDAEPESARAAFDMALGRLRKLLGGVAALRLDAGRLLPDEQAMWFDTAQQRELVARITRPGTEPAQALALAQRLIAAYGGAFVSQAGDTPWVLAARERQLARLSRGVRVAADLQRITGDEAAAEALLLAAIEAAPTDEALAQRLMALHQARGDAAQAARAFGHLQNARDAAALAPPSLPAAQPRDLLKS